MKGDFSRQTFDPKKHYSGVWMQQGRVQVDADWNEQQAINQYRTETQASDVIGMSGAPIHDPDTDFKITVEGEKGKRYLQIGRGHYYIHGLLCENAKDIPYDQQAYLPEHQHFANVLASTGNTTLLALLYLDTWQRHITALDDPQIRDVALGGAGGPDTTTRTQAVWQVKALPLPLPSIFQEKAETLKRLVAQPANPQRDHEIERCRYDLDEYWCKTTCHSFFQAWDELTAPRTGRLQASCDGGYQLLDNQLYRVEVHHGSDREKGPTFKWSRDNGSVATRIEAIQDNTVIVEDPGSGDMLHFQVDQWVELVNDLTEMEGKPGQLLRIIQVNSATRTITLDGTPKKIAMQWKPKLRRWDQVGSAATEDGLQINSDWLALEGGIQVQFSSGTYKTGDYWLIPARTATGNIEWPTEGSKATPVTQAPLGIQHHYSRLALVMVDLYENTLRIQDCRKHFPPLSSTAMHILRTNWTNDSVMPLSNFIEKGLTITLDAVPDKRSVKAATVVVTLEVLLLGELEERMLPHSNSTLTGFTNIEDNMIHWQWLHGRERKLVDWLSHLMHDSRVPTLIRVRATLKGHAIWGIHWGQQIYLDGQAFGYSSERSQGEKEFAALGNYHERNELVGSTRIDLSLPSGNGARASNFESWFYLSI